MSSVTQRIKQIKQPKGGYINPKNLSIVELKDSNILNEQETVHAALIGLAVDYMTRFMLGTDKQEAFRVSLTGAKVLSLFTGNRNSIEYANELINNIIGLDDNSIICACRLVGYDVCYRAGIAGYKPVEYIVVDKNTINNIRIMINRGLKFIEEYGPIIMDGFTFEDGYTDLVSSGDGDFLTRDTLWDFKVSKNKPTKEHTLQLLMYYLMGKHSVHWEFDSINRLGIFNPRLNCVYLVNIGDIEQSIINEVSRDVIGYKE